MSVLNSVARRTGALLLVAAAAAPLSAQAVAPAASDATISVTGVAGVGPAGTTLTRSVRVDRGDLDLRTLAGQRRLASRISKAADDVCADVGLWTPRSTHDYYRCRDTAIETASAQVAGGVLMGAE